MCTPALDWLGCARHRPASLAMTTCVAVGLAHDGTWQGAQPATPPAASTASVRISGAMEVMGAI
jgi:hypothetical protein